MITRFQLLTKSKLELNFKAGAFSEIYQQTGMKFAFLSAPKDGNKQCHKFVLCRDFLNDAVKYTITKKEVAVYGFKYNKDNPPVDLTKMRMLVTKTSEDKELPAKMLTSLKLLHIFETRMGLVKSSLFKVKGDQPVWLFVGSGTWVKSPFLVSLYTFLIRLGDKLAFLEDVTSENVMEKLKVIKEKCEDNDAGYLNSFLDKIDMILAGYKSLLLGTSRFDKIYSAELPIVSFHNGSGIKSLCDASTPSKELNDKVKELCKND